MDGEDREAVAPYPSKRQKTLHYSWDDAASHPVNHPYGLQHDRYTIAWICALPIELAAARAMLDDIHEAPNACINDSNAYLLGNIGRHNVVVACLPNAQYGTNNAANVLTHLVRTFPSIRLGLMVGIGGGVPSMADIRLGDVVVGTRIMQYDLGKIVEDGGIQRTAIPKTPHHSFGTAVSVLRAEHELRPSRIPSILRHKLGDHTGYGRPSSPDRLFAATYQHIAQTPNCEECDQSKLALRRLRVLHDPMIHYGVIASGNQVMRSGTTRDNVARELDAVCFEMEAAGLMDILPCLPIRGICDYSDSHKNKEWQRYAAATAAAYATELLEVLPAPGAPRQVSSTVNTAQAPLSQNHRIRLLDSLRYDQIDSRKLTIKSAHAKTCRWFLNHVDYQSWLDPEQVLNHCGFLWIRGKPGAGKSTIMKFLYSQTKKIAQDTNTLIASFFFNARGEQLEKSITGMYRSLLIQLLEGYPDLQAVFDDTDLIPRNQTGCPSLNVLKDLFCNAVSSLGQRSFTCFIDALDECDEQEVRTMVQDLEDLADRSTEMGISLRICFSSRHYPYIVIRRGIQITLEDQPGHAEDLENYVGNRLAMKDRALLKELRPQILEKAAGVFLWVVLVVDILNKEDRRGRLAIRKRLTELPSGLSELFKDMLKRDRDNLEDLLLCVLWILFAQRPLKPEEYYHALWSGLSLKGLVDDEIPDVTSLDVVDTVHGCVVSSSKGLAEITRSKRPTIQFIHESVRDFLIKEKGLHELWPDLGFDCESPSHEKLKECCNMYINRAAVAFKTEPSAFPFLEYASQNVFYHADAAAMAVPQEDFLSKFPLPDWIGILNKTEKYKTRKYDIKTTLLYILAERNLVNLIRARSDRGSCFEIEKSRYGCPLFAALALGGHETVREFLDFQAQLQPANSILHDLCKKYSENESKRITLGRSFKYSKPRGLISQLQEKGDEIISAFLILSGNIGVEFDITSKEGRTALYCAVTSGSEMVAQLLLEKGANIESRDRDGRTPLSYAAGKGRGSMVLFLLEKGAILDSQNKTGRTPLSYAAQSGHEAVVQILLDKHIDVSRDSDIKHSAATPPIRSNYEKADYSGRTPLSWAASVGREAVVRLMLANKHIDPDHQDKTGRTPLSYAAASGSYVAASGQKAVVQLLLGSEKVDPDRGDKRCRTPLSYAAEEGCTTIIQLLLATGRVNPDTRSTAGRTPLSYLAYRGRESIFIFDNLRASDPVDVGSEDSPDPKLILSSPGPEPDVVLAIKLLLDTERVDVDSKDKTGRTPLSYAVEVGGEAVVRLLLATGNVDPDFIDDFGRTPLSRAAKDERILPLLRAYRRSLKSNKIVIQD